MPSEYKPPPEYKPPKICLDMNISQGLFYGISRDTLSKLNLHCNDFSKFSSIFIIKLQIPQNLISFFFLHFYICCRAIFPGFKKCSFVSPLVNSDFIDI